MKKEKTNKAQTYQTMAQNLKSHADLLKLWAAIKNKDTPNWEKGMAFEYLVIRAFQFEGLSVRWPYEVTLPQKFGIVEQIDGVVYFENRAFLIESKDHKEPIDIEPIAKLRLQLERRPSGTMGFIFSVKDFTLPAEVFAQFANPMNILLWGLIDFEYAITQSKMVKVLSYKMRQAEQNGLPFVKYGGK